jgi:hypothetical protein
MWRRRCVSSGVGERLQRCGVIRVAPTKRATIFAIFFFAGDPRSATGTRASPIAVQLTSGDHRERAPSWLSIGYAIDVDGVAAV